MSGDQTQGWQFADTGAAEWQTTPDGAEFKLVGVADGFALVVSKLEPGGNGKPHDHEAPEFLYVLDGDLTSNGVPMTAGHGYVAATGSRHSEFTSKGGCTFVSVFKLG